MVSIHKVLLSSEKNNKTYSIKPRTSSDTIATPTMTSNTAPSGEVLFSTQANATTLGAWRAFNKAEDAIGWQSLGSTTGYIGYDFKSPKKISKYTLRSGAVANISMLPKDWTLEGSDDNVEWEVLDTQTEQSWTTLNTDKDYFITNPKDFQMCRLNITANNGHATVVGLNEFKLYEEDSPLTLVELPSSDETMFVEHGINLTDFNKFPLNSIFTKKETVQEGGGTTSESISSTICDVFGKDENGEQIPIGISYYTDDPDKTSAELEITANYSPLDEFDEDFEVVTWTDESTAVTGDRILNMNAIPKPHLIKQVNPLKIQSEISDFVINNANNPSKMFLLSNDKITWKKWDGIGFTTVSVADETTIPTNAMTATELASITKEQWDTWNNDDMYLGIYLDDTATISNISYSSLSAKESTQISDARLYILNTISTINVQFAGSTLTGVLDDEDKGKVQYRVILNDQNYYPKDGSFTALEPAPVDVSLTIPNTDILIDQNNKIRVEFKDFWGTVDFWEANFVGTYSGLLFTDTSGEYYSTEIGEVLKKLDFGIIIAGQTTIENEIVLKNTYGYPVNNISIRADQSKFPTGMKAEFGTNIISFEGLDFLELDGQMIDGEEKTFFIRLTSQLGVTPSANGEFDIIVNASRVKDTIE